MHSMNIAHRALKPDHIKIDDNCKIKISGFDRVYQFDPNDDESVVAEDEMKWELKDSEPDAPTTKTKKNEYSHAREKRSRHMRAKLIPSLWYTAPEVLLSQSKPSTLIASDIWSIGCIFAELLQMQRDNRPDPTKRGKFYHQFYTLYAICRL